MRRQERALDIGAVHLVNAERLHAMSAQKGNQARAYLMTGSPAYLEALRATRAEIGRIIAMLRREVDLDEERRLVDEIEAAEARARARAPGDLRAWRRRRRSTCSRPGPSAR